MVHRKAKTLSSTQDAYISSMSVQAWADASRNAEYHSDPEHQRAIDTVQNLLESKTDSDSAARRISTLYEPLIKRRTGSSSPVAILWAIISDATRVLGGNTDISTHLVDLLQCISKLPDVVDEHGHDITAAWKSAGVYWKGLPEFAMIFREYGIGGF